MISEFLKRAAEKNGWRRDRYIEKNIPTSFSNLFVLPFFGDRRREFILSTILLPWFLKERWQGRYLIVCSFPGRQAIYPYAGEYWSLQDDGLVKKLMEGANGFGNDDEKSINFIEQRINKYFEHCLDSKDFTKYYNNGFTLSFFEDCKSAECILPEMVGVDVELNKKILQRAGYKVFVCPTKQYCLWKMGEEQRMPSKKKFWVDLCEELVRAGFVPIVYCNLDTWDISPELENKCVYVTEKNILQTLVAMRSTGCVLDVFSDFYRWSLLARCPFVSCVERSYYYGVKDYEIDDLCNQIPRNYIFSFPTIIGEGQHDSIIQIIVRKLLNFIPSLNRDNWMGLSEIALPIDRTLIRQRKKKAMRAKFIKINRFNFDDWS